MDSNPENRYLEKALKLLALRPYSERELVAKLRAWQPPCDHRALAAAVAYCRDHRFLDDEQFAFDYAGLLHSRGCGVNKLRRNLRNRLIAPELAEQVIAAASTPEAELECALAAGKFKLRCLKKDEPRLKKREKLYRFLLSRGFAASTVREASKQLLAGDAVDDASSDDEY